MNKKMNPKKQFEQELTKLINDIKDLFANM